VFDMGRMAVFMDPTGAAFSIWQPIKFPGSAIVNETGTFAWNELITTDVDAAKAFYSALFGWQPETHEAGPMSYTEWKLGGRSVGGMMQKPADMPAQMPSLWTVYFLVDDCDAAAAKVKELGGNVMREPMDIEPGRFAVLADPTGAAFCVMKLKDAAG
jgi:predicted enzyme related to lactoylglutathione lyase